MGNPPTDIYVQTDITQSMFILDTCHKALNDLHSSASYYFSNKGRFVKMFSCTFRQSSIQECESLYDALICHYSLKYENYFCKEVGSLKTRKIINFIVILLSSISISKHLLPTCQKTNVHHVDMVVITYSSHIS